MRKRAPGCRGDEILPSYIGITINHLEGSLLNNPGSNGMSRLWVWNGCRHGDLKELYADPTKHFTDEELKQRDANIKPGEEASRYFFLIFWKVFSCVNFCFGGWETYE